MWFKKLKNGTLTIILLFLILTSLVQTFFIWGESLKGFPFNIFSNGTVDETVQLTLGNIFSPSGIYMGKGLDQPRYMLTEGSFETAWNDTKRYLSQIFMNEGVTYRSIDKYTLSAWKKIATKKGFYITLPFDIESEFLECFLDCASEQVAIQDGIRAIAVLPWDNINRNLLNVYIRTAYEIYKYTIEVQDLDVRKAIYDDVLRNYEESDYIQYHYLSDVFPEGTLTMKVGTSTIEFETNGTLLISNDVDSVENNVGIKIKNALSIQSSTTDEGYVNEVVSKISEISNKNETNYITSINSENTVILKNINDIYKYYEEGVLEYNYISGTNDKTEGNYSTMISDLTKQINIFSNFIDTEKLFLSGIKQENGLYIYTFDYISDGIPIAISIPYAGDTASSIIEMVSDGQNIISYRIVPIEIIKSDERIKQSLDFVNFLDDLALSISNFENFSLKYYSNVYDVSGMNSDTSIFPKWKIVSFANVEYIIDRTE